MIRRTSTQKASPRKTRQASITVEFLIAFPILIIATLAIVQFGMIALIQHTVAAAAIEGAREAAKLGASTDDVAQTVGDILGVYQIDLEETAQPAASNQGDAHLKIVDGSGPTTETVGNSDIICDPPGAGPSATQVKVIVCLELDDVLPDLLTTLGFSIADRTLTASSLATFE